ncbi:hypothetical protein O3M35_008878 [Rhynocoris fuscipes]|uniref:Uncharacterized protein n=1 Tax=Rhynocoris fuscipes TaxID=488301 RepID=A0AAW1DEU0_9HEMI
MAICVPCFVIPFFLFIWRFIQPWILMFWNPEKLPQSENKTITENNDSKCPMQPATSSSSKCPMQPATSSSEVNDNVKKEQ